MALSESLRRIDGELAAGHPDLALGLCRDVQSRYPRALAVQRTLGEIYVAQRKPREALGMLDRALAGDPEDARACCIRAYIHQMHGDTRQALDWYHRACDLRPDDQALRTTYQELAGALGQPPYTPSRMGLARLYLRGDLYTHAIREWESLIAESPDALEAQLGLAETLWRAAQWPAAAARCSRILYNAPSCVKALLLLAAMRLDAGSAEEAASLVQRAAEYDPELRLAKALFADRIAAGDRALRELLAEPLRHTSLAPRMLFDRGSRGSGGLAENGRRVVSRPLVDSRPLTTSGSLGSAPLRPTGPLPPTSPRQVDLPPEFGAIFAEAENMIWGPDGGAMGGSPTAARASQPRVARGAPTPRPAAFIPPALAAQDATMNDTEMHAALNWVHWLKAQGAVVNSEAMVSPPHAPAVSLPQAPARATGPLPPPTPEALRSMFAELAGGDVGGVVEADAIAAGIVHGAPIESTESTREVAPAHATAANGSAPRAETRSRSGPLAPNDGAAPLAAGDAGAPAWSDADAAAAGWVPSGELPEEMAQLRAMPIPEAQPEAVTLEGIEQGLMQSGFTPVEPHAGLLAALQEDASVPLVPSAPPAPAPPAPDDYAGRLAYARARRAAGEVDTAITEYRAVLKNAPDLFGEVVSEIEDSVAEAPEQPDMHRLLGDARVRQGDYLGAIEAYNRAMGLGQAHDGV